MLKLVVIVVIALAEGEERHDPGIAGAAAGGIRALADVVAERIDAEGAVLEEDHAGHAGDQESAERGLPAAPDVAEDGREDEGDE